MHLTDLYALRKMEEMNQPTPVPQPVPDEKAQIVVLWSTPIGTTIIRFKSVKKAKIEHVALLKAWSSWKRFCSGPASARPDPLCYANGDMYGIMLDVSLIAAVCFVDIDKRNKFVPYPA